MQAPLPMYLVFWHKLMEASSATALCVRLWVRLAAFSAMWLAKDTAAAWCTFWPILKAFAAEMESGVSVQRKAETLLLAPLFLSLFYLNKKYLPVIRVTLDRFRVDIIAFLKNFNFKFLKLIDFIKFYRFFIKIAKFD